MKLGGSPEPLRWFWCLMQGFTQSSAFSPWKKRYKLIQYVAEMTSLPPISAAASLIGLCALHDALPH